MKLLNIAIMMSLLLILSTTLNAKKTRDHVLQIVSDDVTRLQWQDNETDTSNLYSDSNWTLAYSHCKDNVRLGGYTDWRVPNIYELITIFDPTPLRTLAEVDQSMLHQTFVNYQNSHQGLLTSTRLRGLGYFAAIKTNNMYSTSYEYDYNLGARYNMAIVCVRNY